MIDISRVLYVQKCIISELFLLPLEMDKWENAKYKNSLEMSRKVHIVPKYKICL
jgi:hypothetical protein